VTAVTAPATPVMAAVPSGRAGLRQAVRSEWTKFWTVRSTPISFAATAVAVIGICVLTTATVKVGDTVADPTRRSLIGFLLGQLAIGVLGVLVITAEYSTGTIRATFAAMPRRPVVLMAKVLVFGAVTLVVSEALAFVCFAVGQAILSGTVPTASLGQPGVLRAVVGAGIYLAFLGLFALGIGSVLRHSAGAITTYAGILLVLPLIVQTLPTSVQNAVSRYMPANIGVGVFSVRPHLHVPTRVLEAPAFGPWAGLGVLLAYAAAALVIGGVLLVRRDA